MKNIIVAYDISSDNQRNKLAKALLEFGIRTQKSLFECEVNEKELRIIKKIVSRYSEPEDFITIYEIKKEPSRIGDVKYIEVDDLVF